MNKVCAYMTKKDTKFGITILIRALEEKKWMQLIRVTFGVMPYKKKI